MELVETRSKLQNHNVGFIDCDKIHTDVVKSNPVETERNLLRFLKEQHYCTDILFPYNFE